MSEWLKLIIPAAFVAIIALLWSVVRPVIGRMIFYFIEHRDMRTYFRQYVGETMPDLAVSIETTASAVRSLQNTVTATEQTRQNQHQDNVSAQERLSNEIEKLDGKMDTVTDTLNRIEGREEARYNSTRRRRDDPR